MNFLLISAIVVATIQLGYFILFIIAFKKKPEKRGDHQIPVSIIVCARNEESNLRQLIPSILKQVYPVFEVIVVDDRSSDETYSLLKDMQSEDERLRVVQVRTKPEHFQGKKYGLTLGIKSAQYDWVLLTDADCMPLSEKWISEMMSGIQGAQEIVLGFSSYTKKRGLLNAFIRFETLLTGIQYIGWAILGRPYMGVGRNLAYKKSLFLQNKGFNSHMSMIGGDDDLFINHHATRRNTAIRIGHEALVESIPAENGKDFFYQKLRHLAVGKRYKVIDKILLGMFSGSWILFWIMAPLSVNIVSIYLMAGIMVLRWSVLAWLLHRASIRLGFSFERWKVPLLDFFFAIYYLVVGLNAFVAKNIRWRS